jgi:hypothetical protein
VEETAVQLAFKCVKVARRRRVFRAELLGCVMSEANDVLTRLAKNTSRALHCGTCASCTSRMLKSRLALSASKDGKVNVNYQGWDAGKVVLEGQVFEVRWGPQGVEGRIVEGGRGKVGG